MSRLVSICVIANAICSEYALFTAATVLSTSTSLQDHSVATHSLLLPGKVLHISALLVAKRFRDKGNKEGAVRAIKRLQEAGLGNVNHHEEQAWYAVCMVGSWFSAYLTTH